MEHFYLKSLLGRLIGNIFFCYRATRLNISFRTNQFRQEFLSKKIQNQSEAFSQNQSYIIFALTKAVTPTQDSFTPTKLLYQKKKQQKNKNIIREVEYHQKRTFDNFIPGHAIHHLQVLHTITLVFLLLVREKFQDKKS